MVGVGNNDNVLGIASSALDIAFRTLKIADRLGGIPSTRQSAGDSFSSIGPGRSAALSPLRESSGANAGLIKLITLLLDLLVRLQAQRGSSSSAGFRGLGSSVGQGGAPIASLGGLGSSVGSVAPSSVSFPREIQLIASPGCAAGTYTTCVKSGALPPQQAVKNQLSQSGVLPTTDSLDGRISPAATSKAADPITAFDSKNQGGYIWPVRGKDGKQAGEVSSHHGPRGGRIHAGTDIAAPIGTPVVATAAGTVERIQYDPEGYGNYIDIRHPATGSLSRYAHLDKPPNLQVGQAVKQGEQIGVVGNTGRSTGPHLHFEIRDKDTALFGGAGTKDPLTLLATR